MKVSYNAIYKICGQSAPAAATLTSLYACPASTQAVVSIFVTNRAAVSDTIRIALLPKDETIATKHYIAYGNYLLAGDTLQYEGIYINTGDQVVVYSTNGTCSFTLTGQEINRARMAVE